MMKLPKKEKKPIDLKNYIRQMEKSMGRKDKIKEVLDNEVAFKKYLVSLGMNPEWTELAAVMEIIKNRFSKNLKDRPRNFRIRESKLFMGKTELAKTGLTHNNINLNEFELGDGEVLRYSPYTGTIDYIKTKSKSNLEKREIDPKTGVVMRHLKRFGGNASNELDDDYYSAVEYVRDPNEPKVTYITSYKNANRKGEEVSRNETVEYDFGYPIELEKNGTTHRKTPIYFIKRYPRYEAWFNSRFRSQDEYVKNVFAMQKDVMRELWRTERQMLQSIVIRYAKTRDELDVYYKGLQEIFKTSIIGPVYKAFILSQIELIIDNDELHMFYEDGAKEEMKARILARLEEEVEPKPLQEMVQETGEKVVDRITSNPDFQTAKETFTGEVKSVEDDDYSIEEALSDIHDQSNMVVEFKQESNPFSVDKEGLDEKIKEMERQMKILKTAYRAFPRRKKNIKSAIKEIEDQKVKKPDIPVNPTNNDNEAR